MEDNVENNAETTKKPGGVTGKGFMPGQSGNPGGRPKENAEVRDLARQHTKLAIERLVFWLESDNARASTSAATAILDRGWGKAPQAIEHSGPDGGDIEINTSDTRKLARAVVALLQEAKLKDDQ